MFDSESVPKRVPEPGFYYHNKHTAEEGVNGHAYEFVGTGYHTETGEHTALYRPLYEDAWSYQNGKMIYVRPLEMFMETIEKNREMIRRFRKIEDQNVIKQLIAIRNQMYP